MRSQGHGESPEGSRESFSTKDPLDWSRAAASGSGSGSGELQVELSESARPRITASSDWVMESMNAETGSYGGTRRTRSGAALQKELIKGTTSAIGVDSGVGIGEVRHTGQVGCSLSHGSTHFRWKRCPQSGSNRSMSFPL